MSPPAAQDTTPATTTTGGPSLADVAAPTGTPNQYHLHGDCITVSYFPDGFGPVTTTAGPIRFTYQDAYHSLIFRGDEVRTVDVPDLGTIVSVTLIRAIDLGSTSFSLLVPHVTLPAQLPASATVTTDGITTVHRTFLGAIGHAQTETYTFTRLTGTAAIGILPL